MSVPPDDLLLNRVLAALPDDRRAQVAEAASRVGHDARDPVFEQGERIEQVLFPLTGVYSLVARFEQHSVEIATVGNEGMLGLPVFLQAAYTSAHQAFCQVPAESARLSVDAFTTLISANGDLHQLMHRYTQALFTQIAQNAACNAVHNTTQRAARWILMTHDRVGDAEFLLTQDFLAQMLGVRRTAVNAAAQALQRAGSVTYSRARMTVIDRDALLQLACPCYGIIRAEHDRLLTP